MSTESEYEKSREVDSLLFGFDRELLKKIVDRASKQLCQCGKQGNVGITHLLLPLAYRLCRNTNKFTKFALGYVILGTVCFDFLRNGNMTNDDSCGQCLPP